MRTYLQMHPHDLLLGPQRLGETFAEIGSLTGVVLGVNTVPEVHPIVNGISIGETYDPGLWYPSAGSQAFSLLGEVVNADTQAAFHEGVEFLTERVGAENVILWVSLLYGGFSKEEMRSLRGEPIEHWICPNRPGVVSAIKAALAELAQKYPNCPIMIDRIRFPDWTSSCGLDGLAGCFCNECVEDMRRSGINPAEIHHKWLNAAGQGERGLYDMLWCLDRMQGWRKEVIHRFIDSVTPSGTSIWPDVWPPEWGEIFGQPLDIFSQEDTLKVQAYRKLAGGADLRILVTQISNYLTLDEDTVFEILESYLGHPWGTQWSTFQADGYGTDYVTFVLQNTLDKRRALPGIQAWNTEVRVALSDVAAAHEAGADGVIIYCFGWVPVKDLASVVEFARDLPTKS